MSNTDPKYWTEQQRQEIRQIGSLHVSEFRKLMRECLAEQSTKPEPARKQITYQDVWGASNGLCERFDSRWGMGFMAGVRFAEKHHDIIAPNRSPATTDANNSIDLQSKCRGDKL
jgi:hypothetical protein